MNSLTVSPSSVKRQIVTFCFWSFPFAMVSMFSAAPSR
jgi:hypothetical protein